MPRETSRTRTWPRRSVPRTWVAVGGLALVIVMAVIVTVVLLVDRGRDEDRRLAAEAATSTTGIDSPYDLSEVTGEIDLEMVEDAALVSIYLPNQTGTMTSYGVSAEVPAARALMQAIANAEDVGPDLAAARLGARAADSTITFVLPARQTVTFALYLAEGMIAREDQVWQPEGDLRALVEAATSSPE